VTATIAAAPAAVPAGLVTRIKNLVKRITGMPSYTENIGRDMGIVPAKVVKTLKTNEKPVFTVTKEAGHPLLKWKKGSVEGVNIYVDRSDGRGPVLLCGCTRAKYVDMYPLPNTVTNWTYGIIYTKASVEYGIISDSTTIAVMANFAANDNSVK
jgi:hypothetical protein